MHAHLQAPATTVPYLVSYPRTGSHWIRCFLELYFDRPLLTRSFYEHASTDYLLHHTHDLEDEIRDRRDVIYLYRGVTSTVFSQLTYHMKDKAVDAPLAEVLRVAEEYRRSLRKWLLREDVAARKHVIAYEWLLDRPLPTLRGVIDFLGGSPDDDAIMRIWPTITHGSIKERTTHDPRVISADNDTHLRRELFRYRWGRQVIAHFTADADLADAMDPALLA
ncbi:MAG: hypothetical protein SFZ24_00290 [Planctomycetota bacterium]|nr:hypothetical protein [Planctomycetota bacterium]